MPEVLEPTPENVERVAEAVRAGEVVVAPSDTNMALTLDPTHSEAVERAYEIKDRPAHKPLTLFVREPTSWREFARTDRPEAVDALADTFWPGPLNLVLEARDAVPHERLTRDGTVSIGCLEQPAWRALADRIDGPLAMTSANRSGTVPDDELVTVETAVEHVGEAVDYVLKPDSSRTQPPLDTTRASTILRLAGEPEILRQGDLTPADVEGVVPDLLRSRGQSVDESP